MKILVFLATWAISAQAAAFAQNANDQLKRLVETSAKRLAIAEQVAVAKWDSGAPVEDAPRELQVITSAIEKGKTRGLDETVVSNFFKAQIEANKLVQYSLLAEWRRAGKAPDHASVSLAKTIRPQLDQVEAELIEELANTANIRATPSCRADVAKAVGKYLSAHRNGFSQLTAIALDRALAAACTS